MAAARWVAQHLGEFGGDQRLGLAGDSARGNLAAVVAQVLRDEGEAYGKALEAAGVPADVQRYDGLIHGFFDMGTISPAAQAAIDESCARFGKLLHG